MMIFLTSGRFRSRRAVWRLVWLGRVLCVRVGHHQSLVHIAALMSSSSGVAISDIPEFFKYFQEVASVLLVSFGDYHFLSPIVAKAVIIISWNGIMVMHLRETVGWRLTKHDTNEIVKLIWCKIREGLIVFILDNFKGSWARCRDSLELRWVDDRTCRIRSEDIKVLPGKIVIGLRAAMEGYYCPNGIYSSTCIAPLAPAWAIMGVSDIGYRVVTLAMRKKCHLPSLFTISILPSSLQFLLSLLCCRLTPCVPSVWEASGSCTDLCSFRRRRYILQICLCTLLPDGHRQVLKDPSHDL